MDLWVAISAPVGIVGPVSAPAMGQREPSSAPMAACRRRALLALAATALAALPLSAQPAPRHALPAFVPAAPWARGGAGRPPAAEALAVPHGHGSR